MLSITPAEAPTDAAPSPAESGPVTTLADMEWTLVRRALAAHKGNKTAAARALGISLRTLYNKLEARAEGQRSKESPDADAAEV